MKSKVNLPEDKKLEKVRKTLELGIKFLDKGELDKAEKEFKDISKKFPNLTTPWIGLGNVYAAKNNPEEALKNYEHALKISGGRLSSPPFVGSGASGWTESSELYNNLGTLYFVQGDKVKAETYLKLAVQMEKKNLSAKKNLADCYFATGKYQQAIPLYEQVLRKEPDANTLISLANCYFKLGVYESAKLGYEKVLELEPDNKIAKENLNVVRKKIGKKK